jgi:hypothetical protein
MFCNEECVICTHPYLFAGCVMCNKPATVSHCILTVRKSVTTVERPQNAVPADRSYGGGATISIVGQKDRRRRSQLPVLRCSFSSRKRNNLQRTRGRTEQSGADEAVAVHESH